MRTIITGAARHRARAAFVAASAAAALIAGGVLLGATPAEAAVQTADCPVWDANGDAPSGVTDDGVAVYSGGDFAVSGSAAESEGLLVAMGGMSVDKDPAGIFNVGVVVGGSSYMPPANSLMLAVGNDLAVTTDNSLDVGSNVGADVQVGGAVTNPGAISTNGGTLTSNMGAAATSAWAGFGAGLQSDSTSYGSQSATGTTEVQGNSVTFTSTSGVADQFFTIDASQLPSAPELHFVGIPAAASVVVNVTGSTATLSPSYYDVNGVRADALGTQIFSEVASHLAWNFVDATQLSLGGSSQLLGSIFAPKAEATITASTNGRVYIGGDVVMSGTGNELHNYPFCGSSQDITTGGFAVAKAVDNAAGVTVDPALSFGGTYTCVPGADDDGLPVSGTWSTTSGHQDQIDGIPVGYVCTVAEGTPPTVDGGTWGTAPTIEPAAGVTIGDDSEPVGLLTVTNTITPTTPTPTQTPTTPSTPGTPAAPSSGGADGTDALADTGSNVGPAFGIAITAALAVLGARSC